MARQARQLEECQALVLVAVRAHRLHEEAVAGRCVLGHCPTKAMLADTLTKLASAEVILVLHLAMDGVFPDFSSSVVPPAAKLIFGSSDCPSHQTSVTLGPSNRGDIAGDGPSAAAPADLNDAPVVGSASTSSFECHFLDLAPGAALAAAR